MAGRIAIIAAMDRELKPLVRGWRKVRERGLTIYESEQAVAVAGGIGTAPAAMAAMVLIAKEQPSCLVSVGLAGAMRLDLATGDVITPGTVINGVTGKRFTIRGGSGTLLSAKLIAGPEQKRELRARFMVDALDMEAAGIATVAESCGLPLFVVKTISDELEFELPPMMAFVDTEGKFHTGKFTMHLLARPAWWPAALRLARNSNKAAHALAADLTTRLPKIARELEKQGVGQSLHAVSDTERE